MGGCVYGGGLSATKTGLFGKKSGGTHNSQVKKLVGTPNLDEIFASAATLRAPTRGGAKRRRLPETREAATDTKI